MHKKPTLYITTLMLLFFVVAPIIHAQTTGTVPSNLPAEVYGDDVDISPDGRWGRTRDITGVPYYFPVGGTENSSAAPPPPGYGDENWDTRFGGSNAGLNDEVFAIASDDRTMYVGGTFTKTGTKPANAIAKWDGFNWATLGDENANGVDGFVYAIAIDGDNIYVGGQFTSAGGVSAQNIAVWNKTTETWSALGDGVGGGETPYVAAITIDDDHTVYVGGQFLNAGSEDAANVAMYDGSWHALSSGINGTVNGLATDAEGTLWAGGSFSDAGGTAVNSVAFWDGAAWSSPGDGVNGNVNAIVVNEGYVYVGGQFSTATPTSPVTGNPTNNLARWNIEDQYWQWLGCWEPSLCGGYTGNGVNGTVRALAVSGDWLYVGGTFSHADPATTAAYPTRANYVARFFMPARPNNIWFQSLGNGLNNGTDGFINAIGITGSGSDVYVGGSFAQAGEVVSVNLGRWNGREWLPFAGTTSDPIYSFVMIDETIYAAGQFANIGTDAARYNLARLDVDTWISYEGTVAGSVFAMAASDKEIYVGGLFSGTGGKSAINVAQFDLDTKEWKGLTPGSGVAGTNISFVRALTVHQDKLYIGGRFTIADEIRANSIATWDRNTGEWGTFGDGVNGTILAIAVADDGTVYIGGEFTLFDAPDVHNLAMWDGSKWTGLGATPNNTVNSLLLNNGELFVGGEFDSLGTTPTNHIARYKIGSKVWESLGRGIEGDFFPVVQTLHIMGNELYVGGYFDLAGGDTVNNVAMWNLTYGGWVPLGSGTGNQLRAIVSNSNREVFVCGDFIKAGKKPSFYIGLWHAPLTSVEEDIAPAPTELQIGAAPHPVPNATNIVLYLPDQEHVRMTVYDMNGRLVTQLRDEEMSAGSHVVQWDAARLPSGLYFCRYEGDKNQATLPIVVAR